MDLFFEQELQSDIVWPQIYTLNHPPRFSAFAPYSRPSTENSSSTSSSSRHQNLNKRMIQILRAIQAAAIVKRSEPLSNYRHMLNERQRRCKMKQNYDDLLSMLPPKTKNDKNSIVQAAKRQVLELQGLKAELQSRNEELEARLGVKANKAEVARIDLRMPYPSSSIDSMLEVLKCLKGMEVKAKAIRSMLSVQEFSAMLEIESEKNIKTEEVQKGVESALMEFEGKLRCHFPEAIENEADEFWNLWEGQVA